MAPSKMLIDATHPEETRVVVLRNGKVEEFDYESAARKLLRGNIYLAKVTRVEPSLQAAFVEYGGNRHGFLAFGEIHPDYYQIPQADRLALIEAEAEDEAAEEREADARAEARSRRRVGGEGRDHGRRSSSANGQGDQAARGYTDRPTAIDTDADHDPEAGALDVVDLLPSETAGDGSGLVSGTAPPADVDRPDPDRGLALEQSGDPIIFEPIRETRSEVTGPISVPEDPSLDAVTTIEDGGVVETADADDAGPAEPETVGNAAVDEDVMEEVPNRPRRRPRSYKIQEVIKKRQIILVQVVKEERGTKGAALTTYLSLAGRYTVLMPNTGRGGGISRKITNAVDRKRLKAIAQELEVPEGMGLIIRTAGAARTKQEIKRDFEYLLRLWESVRDLTLQSTAPSLVYEEGDLIKRSIRDLYTKDVEEIVVAGDAAFKEARDFMRMLMPSHSKNVLMHQDPEPIFTRYGIERQLNAMFSPYVHLRSGGYLVINQTEALVAIDINSGKATREFSIEETALNTNLEAADEIARQLKLRDLAGLIVIDFIDMEEKRNNRSVERRMKDALRHDRARIQVGRISHFGLLEMSRQRMRTGVLEGSTTQCPHCQGTGIIRSVESIALAVLRGLEDTIMAGATTPLTATTTSTVALYLLNNKRPFINEMEVRLAMPITIAASDKVQGANFTIEKGERTAEMRPVASRTAVNMDWGFDGDQATDVEVEEAPADVGGGLVEVDMDGADEDTGGRRGDGEGEGERDGGRRRRRRRGRGGDRSRGEPSNGTSQSTKDDSPDFEPQLRAGGGHGARTGDGDGDEADQVETLNGDGVAGDEAPRARFGEDGEGEGDGRSGKRGRRRGRRGGRRGRSGDRPEHEGNREGMSAVGEPGAEQPPFEPYLANGGDRTRLGPADTAEGRDWPVPETTASIGTEQALGLASFPVEREATPAVAPFEASPIEARPTSPELTRAHEPAAPAATVIVAAPIVAAPRPEPADAVPPPPAVDPKLLARIAPVASEPVVASVVIGTTQASEAEPPKPARRGWWSRSG